MARDESREAEGNVAVVVAHGIGNQLPMDTVRALVDNVFGKKSGLSTSAPVYNRMDREARFLDLRRLMLVKTRKRPRVDFYELYWQPTFGTGSAGAVLGWALRLLRRTPEGSQMRRVVHTVRIAIGLLLLLVCVLAIVAWVLVPNRGWELAAATVPFLLWALGVARLLVSSVLANVVSDASRWFAPGPGDIEGRDKVRLQGVELLRGLHRVDANNRPRYERIIVVGHSLGAVITYDAIRLAFDELRDPKPQGVEDPPLVGPPDQRQPCAWNFLTGSPTLLSSPNGQADDIARVDVRATAERYHEVQEALDEEQRGLGVPWRVTDFITLGSPLTHALDLLGGKDVTLECRMSENELPSCPPRGEQQHREEVWKREGRPTQLAAGADGKGRVAFYRGNNESGPLRAHEASPFATTRWTNLYIPVTPWLGGRPCRWSGGGSIR
ncbi:membrane hypothetical protein [Nostocoides jenkinsii Ben 74]|uniref:Uncharacterized protein n=2 Tax=Nostocoides jenkinsii TaxID=330834 RepID=A0A077M313_9MICO|nr:membrane hypothetical protein [Tetrasphaera jenkinsii Ben 74]